MMPFAAMRMRGPATQLYGYYPLDAASYGPARYYTNDSIITGTNVTLDGAADQFTIGATTGNLILTGNPTMPVIVGRQVVFWAKAVSGAPTTINVRFITAAGANIGAAQTLTLSGGYYVLATTVPETAAFVNFFCTNTGGTAIIIGRPAMAVLNAGTLDNDPGANLWQTTSAGKASGSGTAATLNADGTVNCPSGAIQYARSDLNVSDGAQHVWQVKVSDPKVRYVLVRYAGTGTGLVYLENWGNGWWGKVTTVPAGVGTTFYARVEVNNNTSTYYTAGTVTIEEIHLHKGTLYPRYFPRGEAATGAYAKSEIVVQQVSNGINVFMPGSNPGTNKYIRWQLRHYTGAAGGGDGWNIERIHEVARTGDDAFMPGDDLTDVGEHLLAVREAGGPHMGGDTHGYQIGSSAVLNIDGTPVTIDGATSYRCSSAELVTVSQMVNGTPRFDVDTSILFSSAGVDVHHTVEALNDTQLVSCYSMLSSARYLNNLSSQPQIFTTAAWAPSYTPVSTAVAGDVINNGERYLLTGDQGISVDAEVTSGWSSGGVSESYVQRASSSVKLYFSPPGIYPDAGPGFSILTGQTVDWTTRYLVDTEN